MLLAERAQKCENYAQKEGTCYIKGKRRLRQDEQKNEGCEEEKGKKERDRERNKRQVHTSRLMSFSLFIPMHLLYCISLVHGSHTLI